MVLRVRRLSRPRPRWPERLRASDSLDFTDWRQRRQSIPETGVQGQVTYFKRREAKRLPMTDQEAWQVVCHKISIPKPTEGIWSRLRDALRLKKAKKGKL